MSSTLTAVKLPGTKVDGEVTGQLGKEMDREETPHMSPVSDEKPAWKKPERQYSREELIELMTHPLSSVRHPCLENPHNKSLVSGRTGVRWLEEKWDNRKRSDSQEEEERSDSSLDPQKKRVNDPKAERLRKEQDVVLSPQRRSFNSGCFVNLPPQHVSANRRPESPSLKGEREPSHREIPARRIGSGRIMRDPMWDFRGVEKEDISNQNINNHDFNFRQRDDRYERRSYERTHDKERPQQRNQRYNNNDRRKYEKNEPEEPEWFSGGPTSQHDTIELHGFDGPMEERTPVSKKQNKNSKNNNTKSNKKVAEALNKTEGVKKSSSRKSSPDVTEQRRLSPTTREKSENAEVPKKTSTSEGKSSDSKNTQDPECMFDFEDILNFDSLPPLLSMANGCEEEGGGSGSRFSQFFRRESPSPHKLQHQDSQHSSTNEEMFNSMINDIVSTNISIPPDRDTYFAPISPAASSVKDELHKGSSASLLEMLHRGNNQGFQGRKITKKPSLRDLEACGKIHSVEELEARLRQEQGASKQSEFSNRSGNKEEELAAFRKLMMNKQIQNMQEQKPIPHSNMSGGFQNQQQQQHSMGQQQQTQSQQQMPIPHDLVMKLLHVQQQQRQQEVFAKLMVPPTRLAPSNQFNVPPPVPSLSPELQMHINNAQPSKDLLQRPEAQAIIRSLKRGELTVHQLVDQLKRNTNIQPVLRDMIASIIKLHGLQSGASQREPSPANIAPSNSEMMHQMLQNQQQLRIPSPHSNVMQRVPSPRELVAHTQNILQNALLKKKLEEQKENFRKRQELQRSHSPNPSGSADTLSPGNQQPSTTSPTPLAFTPTSVLRKMTAEKDSELAVKQHLHSSQLDTTQQPPKQGRAIVKGNNNFSVPPPVIPNVDFMQMPPQFNKLQPPQRSTKAPQTGGNPPPLFMIGMNRNNLQPPPNRSMRNMGGSNMIPPQHQQQAMTHTVQQLLMNHNYNNPQQRNNTLLKPECQPIMRGQGQMQMGRNYNMNYPEGSPASPVSNQLARWFSPELLAQARAGKLPHMPPLSPTQNMLSVEELERLQQAVHN